jgi:hypothetical protein
MATTPNTTFVAGAILTAAQQNNFARGAMAAPATRTTDQSGITAETLITGMSVTFTAVANRLYKFTWFEPYLDSSGNLSCRFDGRVRLTNISGTVLQQARLSFGGGATLNDHYFTLTGVYTPAAGSVTLVCTGAASNSTTCRGAATNPAYFIVEDIGTA